jgi:hypothetical protein
VPDCYFIISPRTRTLFGTNARTEELEKTARRIIKSYGGARGRIGRPNSMLFTGADGQVHVFIHFDSDATALKTLPRLNAFLSRLNTKAVLLYPRDV